MDWRILKFDIVDSTMDIVHLHAQKGEPEGFVVYSETQTLGRGRFKRKWISPKGGIYLSLLLRPEIACKFWYSYPNMVLNAIIDSLVTLCGKDLRKRFSIKPPNDLMLCGKKCAGVLCEARSDSKGRNYLVVGIGLNIYTSRELLPKHAISLSSYIKDVPDRKLVLDRFLKEFELSLNTLHNMKSGVRNPKSYVGGKIVDYGPWTMD